MTKDAQITVRLPVDLRRWLEQQAEQDQRTLSNFLVIKLNELRQQDETKGNDQKAAVGGR
jgi:uncharacterized protein (DUF1778 family)